MKHLVHRTYAAIPVADPGTPLRRCAAALVLGWAATLFACQAGSIDSASHGSPSSSDDAGDGTSGAIAARVTHAFDDYRLASGEETIVCGQWTPGHDQPLYVNRVTMANRGGFHHSNWYVVPKTYVPGPDGYFDCSDRGYQEFTAAARGTVLFAQSTQSRSEVQAFPEGVVLKVPAGHKIVGSVHLLNVASRPRETDIRLTLGVHHPRRVETVLAPLMLAYNDLDIPPRSRARFTGECNLRRAFRGLGAGNFDFELYYVMPHYHQLGTEFDLEVSGGPRDGEQLFALEGFGTEPDGHRFRPPVRIGPEAKGFRFRCSYDNPRDERVDWGIGGDEMCMMLGFTDADAAMSARVVDGNRRVGTEDGVVENRGPCEPTVAPQPPSQDPPSTAEKRRPLEVPESDADRSVEPVPECRDRTGTADPYREPTLTNLETEVFSVSCAHGSCHGSEAPAAGLDLEADDLHAELVDHEVQTPTDRPLVAPGDPDGSWLYRVTSRCDPQTTSGTTSHMPRHSPTLLEPDVVAMIRKWIERGAPDD